MARTKSLDQKPQMAQVQSRGQGRPLREIVQDIYDTDVDNHELSRRDLEILLHAIVHNETQRGHKVEKGVYSCAYHALATLCGCAPEHKFNEEDSSQNVGSQNRDLASPRTPHSGKRGRKLLVTHVQKKVGSGPLIDALLTKPHMDCSKDVDLAWLAGGACFVMEYWVTLCTGSKSTKEMQDKWMHMLLEAIFVTLNDISNACKANQQVVVSKLLGAVRKNNKHLDKELLCRKLAYSFDHKLAQKIVSVVINEMNVASKEIEAELDKEMNQESDSEVDNSEEDDEYDCSEGSDEDEDSPQAWRGRNGGKAAYLIDSPLLQDGIMLVTELLVWDITVTDGSSDLAKSLIAKNRYNPCSNTLDLAMVNFAGNLMRQLKKYKKTLKAADAIFADLCRCMRYLLGYGEWQDLIVFERGQDHFFNRVIDLATEAIKYGQRGFKHTEPTKTKAPNGNENFTVQGISIMANATYNSSLAQEYAFNHREFVTELSQLFLYSTKSKELHIQTALCVMNLTTHLPQWQKHFLQYHEGCLKFIETLLDMKKNGIYLGAGMIGNLASYMEEDGKWLLNSPQTAHICNKILNEIHFKNKKEELPDSAVIGALAPLLSNPVCARKYIQTAANSLPPNPVSKRGRKRADSSSDLDLSEPNCRFLQEIFVVIMRAVSTDMYDQTVANWSIVVFFKTVIVLRTSDDQAKVKQAMKLAQNQLIRLLRSTSSHLRQDADESRDMKSHAIRVQLIPLHLLAHCKYVFPDLRVAGAYLMDLETLAIEIKETVKLDTSLNDLGQLMAHMICAMKWSNEIMNWCKSDTFNRLRRRIVGVEAEQRHISNHPDEFAQNQFIDAYSLQQFQEFYTVTTTAENKAAMDALEDSSDSEAEEYQDDISENEGRDSQSQDRSEEEEDASESVQYDDQMGNSIQDGCQSESEASALSECDDMVVDSEACQNDESDSENSCEEAEETRQSSRDPATMMEADNMFEKIKSNNDSGIYRGAADSDTAMLLKNTESRATSQVKSSNDRNSPIQGQSLDFTSRQFSTNIHDDLDEREMLPYDSEETGLNLHEAFNSENSILGSKRTRRSTRQTQVREGEQRQQKRKKSNASRSKSKMDLQRPSAKSTNSGNQFRRSHDACKSDARKGERSQNGQNRNPVLDSLYSKVSVLESRAESVQLTLDSINQCTCEAYSASSIVTNAISVLGTKVLNYASTSTNLNGFLYNLVENTKRAVSAWAKVCKFAKEAEMLSKSKLQANHSGHDNSVLNSDILSAQFEQVDTQKIERLLNVVKLWKQTANATLQAFSDENTQGIDRFSNEVDQLLERTVAVSERSKYWNHLRNVNWHSVLMQSTEKERGMKQVVINCEVLQKLCTVKKFDKVCTSLKAILVGQQASDRPEVSKFAKAMDSYFSICAWISNTLTSEISRMLPWWMFLRMRGGGQFDCGKRLFLLLGQLAFSSLVVDDSQVIDLSRHVLSRGKLNRTLGCDDFLDKNGNTLHVYDFPGNGNNPDEMDNEDWLSACNKVLISSMIPSQQIRLPLGVSCCLCQVQCQPAVDGLGNETVQFTREWRRRVLMKDDPQTISIQSLKNLVSQIGGLAEATRAGFVTALARQVLLYMSALDSSVLNAARAASQSRVRYDTASGELRFIIPFLEEPGRQADDRIEDVLNFLFDQCQYNLPSLPILGSLVKAIKNGLLVENLTSGSTIQWLHSLPDSRADCFVLWDENIKSPDYKGIMHCSLSSQTAATTPFDWAAFKAQQHAQQPIHDMHTSNNHLNEANSLESLDLLRSKISLSGLNEVGNLLAGVGRAESQQLDGSVGCELTHSSVSDINQQVASVAKEVDHLTWPEDVTRVEELFSAMSKFICARNVGMLGEQGEVELIEVRSDRPLQSLCDRLLHLAEQNNQVCLKPWKFVWENESSSSSSHARSFSFTAEYTSQFEPLAFCLQEFASQHCVITDTNVGCGLVPVVATSSQNTTVTELPQHEKRHFLVLGMLLVKGLIDNARLWELTNCPNSLHSAQFGGHSCKHSLVSSLNLGMPFWKRLFCDSPNFPTSSGGSPGAAQSPIAGVRKLLVPLSPQLVEHGAMDSALQLVQQSLVKTMASAFSMSCEAAFGLLRSLPPTELCVACTNASQAVTASVQLFQHASCRHAPMQAEDLQTLENAEEQLFKALLSRLSCMDSLWAARASLMFGNSVHVPSPCARDGCQKVTIEFCDHEDNEIENLDPITGCWKSRKLKIWRSRDCIGGMQILKDCYDRYLSADMVDSFQLED